MILRDRIDDLLFDILNCRPFSCESLTQLDSKHLQPDIFIPIWVSTFLDHFCFVLKASESDLYVRIGEMVALC